MRGFLREEVEDVAHHMIDPREMRSDLITLIWDLITLIWDLITLIWDLITLISHLLRPHPALLVFLLASRPFICCIPWVCCIPREKHDRSVVECGSRDEA